MTVLTDRRVAPFGHLGITACVPLPRASRSLPRPSSPPCAQASPTCLPSLDHKKFKQIRASSRNLPLPILILPSRRSNRHERTTSTVKIPFPTNQSPAKDQTDDPSSVLHFSNSVRDSLAVRGEPCIVKGR